MERRSMYHGRKRCLVEQLRALGHETRYWLSSDALLKMNKKDALVALQKLQGVGTFSAELRMLKGAGNPDAFPNTEMRLHRAVTKAYQLNENSEIETLLRIAEKWKPYRTWVGLHLHNYISK